ncbi:DUF6308 family protein [Kineococcus rhizosphaerae]|uniref:Uncharacterized protein n=1 Tax=Kineococcus rhizosphaerae TaxID=559628 RepID=A0A2T0QKT4_9ACTN|nr:DUF6308 family protein [Kineococcus rhizosphaerae]PRY04920.1 hypothetical protein CLV37_1432 [Kineococcus rhizosphaerae]
MPRRTARPPFSQSRAPLSRVELLALVEGEEAVADLRAYLTARTGEGRPAWTGARFEALAGGGDRAQTAFAVHADDIAALTLLSVSVLGEAVLALLEGEVGDQVAQLLAQVPREVSITDPDAAERMGPDQPLWQAWELLNAQRGLGWVSAAKLLARKRPALVPVYDRVVRCAFGYPQQPWAWLVEHFADAGADLAGRLAAAREQAGVDEGVRVLRVLDVIVWMRHHRQHNVRACPGLATVEAGLPASAS